MYAMASDGKYLSVYTLLRNEDYIRFLRRSKFKKIYSCRRGHIMQSLPVQATNKQPQRNAQHLYKRVFKMINISFVLLLVSCLLSRTLAQDDNATCIAESLALVSNETVAGLYANLRTAIEADVKADFMQFCSVLSRSCTVNVTDYSGELTSACTEAGGQVASKQVTLDCEGNLMNVPIPGGIDVHIKAIPACVGASCDPDNLPPEIIAVFDAGVDEVATEIEAAVAESADITCNGGQVENAGSGALWMNFGTFYVVTVFLALRLCV
jgi:hypothetical protein